MNIKMELDDELLNQIVNKGQQQHHLQQQHQHQHQLQQRGTAPETAATAMVVVARLILVILICVLLIKLRAPKGQRRQASHRAACLDGDRWSAEAEAEERLKGHQSQPEAQLRPETVERPSKNNTVYMIFRKLFNFQANDLSAQYSQNNKLIVDHYDQNNGREINSTLKRKFSQPELVSSSSKAQQLAADAAAASSAGRAQHRPRRHSDTMPPRHLKLPPGPMGLPFLGYLPFVSNEIHLTLTSLSERYGPIYQIFLGGIRVVVLNDASLVRQAFKQPVFSGRPDTQLTRILQGYGIVNSEGALWKEQRAFLHTALRKLGAKSLMNGSNGLEAKIQNQVREFVSDLSVHASEGKPCQVRPMVARAVSSVVGSIVMNLTYRKYEEKEKFDRLIELMQEGFRLFTIAMPLDFIPIFRFLPGVSYAYKKMKKNRAETSAFFQGVADEHRKYLSKTFNLGTPSSASSLHPRTGACNNIDQAAASAVSVSATAVVASTRLGGALVDSTTFAANKTPATGATENQEQLAASATPSNQLGSQLNRCALAAAEASQQGHLATPANGQVSQHQLAAGGQTEEASLAQRALIVAAGQQAESVHEDVADAGKAVPAQLKGLPSVNKQHVELESIVARDLVDAYIVQQKKHEKDGKENYFSDQQLVQIMSDIFSAGLETVTSTIEWSILFLILNTSCQDKIQTEIDQVIGRERSPQLDDLALMPYTEATIYEVLRRSNVVALGNAHATLDDASIGGYRIPKGTQVLPNLYGIHMNPKLWDQPDRFDPSRFIVNERAQKPDYFIPFSVGRRMCLGDVLAKMEVFLFLVGLLQKYDLAVAEEDRHCPPQVKGTIGVSNTPASFRVALHNRANRSEPKTATSSDIQLPLDCGQPTE